MKTATKCAAQGDVYFRRVEAMPEGAEEKGKPGEPVVVAHSETGHHHVARGEAVRLFGVSDPMVCYLSIGEPYADVEHLRPHDTHETIRLPAGLWEVRRQREHAPEGWRRVED